MKTLLFLPVISLLFLQPLTAQDQAERLFDNAVTFMNAGKYQEALTDFTMIIDSHGDTPWAPRALLRLGDYYLNTQDDHVTALTHFEQIKKRYAESTEAPAAYYFKAFIMERHGASKADLESAVSDLIRMNNLYPENPWRGGALFLFGKLQFRLGDFDQSLSFFQRLAFSFPDSSNLPSALLLSARGAYLDGQVKRASMLLARLQAGFPESPEALKAAAWLRLLSRFAETDLTYTADRAFFGARPKQFNSPLNVRVSTNGQLGLQDSKGAYLMDLTGGAKQSYSEKDFGEFTEDRAGNTLLVYKNRLVGSDKQSRYNGLDAGGDSLRNLRSAAVDEFGRMFVVDASLRDMAAFNGDGSFIKKFGLNRPRLVRTFDAQIWVLDDDGDKLRRFDSDFNAMTLQVQSYKNTIDFCFDAFGNLYLLWDRGSQLVVCDPTGAVRFQANLKSGAFPLKQAQGVAVDASGAIYLTDKRGGALVRFQ